jgi:heme a synthase
MFKNNAEQAPILTVHRRLLTTAAVFTTLLIAMGGILCVTQSIRNCPDWPGCFGKVVPPAETGPILEYTHRLLAGISSLLIISTGVLGMVRVPQQRWVSIPPIVAMALLLEVSYFGAQVVLHGLAPGWAAVDIGSALLVVALMVTAAVKAAVHNNNPNQSNSSGFRTDYSKLLLATVAVVYVVLISGVLVAGKGSFTGCLGWPIYSLQQFNLDGHFLANTLRVIVSVIGVGMLLTVLVLAWQRRQEQRGVYNIARWVGLAFLVEAIVQILLQVFGLITPLLLVYTVVASAFWALLVAMTVKTSMRLA